MRKMGMGLVALMLCAALICPQTAGAAEPLWSRATEDGRYVTYRLPCPAELLPDDEDEGRYTQLLCARYADTREPVGMSSYVYDEGCVFATVPAERAGRPLEVFQGELAPFPDVDHHTSMGGHVWPGDADDLYVRGILQGDGGGRLDADRELTRAQAFALIVRLLGAEAPAEPVELPFADVSPSDWYYGTVAAAYHSGIAASADRFYPDRPVTRGELMTMVYRAFEGWGWARPSGLAVSDLDLEDGGEIPSWAIDAYCFLYGQNRIGVADAEQTDRYAGDGEWVYNMFARPGTPITRGEAFDILARAISWLPVYPTQVAIDYGFDGGMPVLDGSTSAYPYTRAVYRALFHNGENHPEMPAAHSKSMESYRRLMRGEADAVFAAVKPTAEVQAELDAAGVELEYIPVSYDAMVFFTNGENPVANLTVEQLHRIYVDAAYLNWKQVGGTDARLVPICRNGDSGSQTLMEQFILDGKRIHPKIQAENTSYAMSSILVDVAVVGWDNRDKDVGTAYGLGYSVYGYYSTNRGPLDIGEETLKLLAIDGVAPTEQTIADGSYPLAGHNYLVLRADAPEGSPERNLAAYLQSEGKDVLSGYVY